MPTHTLTEDYESESLTFSYCDTGVPLDSNLNEEKDYKTLVLLHGLGFNAYIFERLFPLANKSGVRIIAIHRRLYSQSTPFSAPELQIIHNGTLSEKSNFWDFQGKVLAQLIAELIVTLDLGQVALIGWSLGSAFLLYVINACATLDGRFKGVLVEHVRSVIIWDPPASAFGFVAPPNAYIPFLDNSIAPEARARRFNEYVSSYFTHKYPIGDMGNSSDVSIEDSINYQPDTDKAPSISNMSSEGLNRIIDTLASNIDRTIGESSFLEDGRGRTVLQNKVRNALINPETRALGWKNTTFVCLYGDRNSWYAPVAVHGIQKLLNEANDPERLKTTFKVIKGANHFVMWDDPELTLRSLAECL